MNPVLRPIAVAAAVLLVPVSGNLFAQVPGEFRQVDIDGGGWFTGIVQHSSGRLYGRTDVGGVYRSDDRGEEWVYLSGDFPNAGSLFPQGIAVADGDVDTVYQACGVSYFSTDPGRGIWKSSDGGATWSHVKTGVNFSGNDSARHGGECLIIHPGDDDEVWAGSRGDGLWRTTDAGVNWNKVGGSTFDGVVITAVYIHPNFPDQVWVGGEGGLWMSWDRGASWSKPLNSGVVYRMVRADDGSGFVAGGRYGPSNESETSLWRVTKGNWNQAGTPTFTDRWSNYLDAHQAEFGWRPVETAAVCTLLSDGRLVAGAFFRNLGVSGNEGSTFSMLPTTLEGAEPVWGLAPPSNGQFQTGWTQVLEDVSDPDQWYVTGGYGPARTDNGGTTWKMIVAGIGEVVGWRPIFHPTDPDIVLLPIADHGMTTVQDGGVSGASVGTISRHFPWPDDILTFAHAGVASGDRILAAGGAPISAQARLWRSDDRGANWSKVSPNGWPQSSGNEWLDVVADRGDPDDIVALMGGTIGSGSGGIYRSTNGGVSFSQRSLPADAQGYDAGGEFVWDSRLEADGGGGARRYLSLRFNGIYRSDNRGASWSKLNPQGLPNLNGWLGVDHGVAGRVWFAGASGLYLSNNAGGNWGAVGGFDEAKQVDAVDGRVAVVGRRGGDATDKIYYSPDNGGSWDEVTREGFRFGNVTSVAVDPWREGSLWIATNGRSFAVFSPWSSLEQWRFENFGSSEGSGLGADGEDPDRDGVSNVYEYALGTDPNDSGSTPDGTLEFGGSGTMRLRHSRVVRDDIIYQGIASEDLILWDVPVTITTDTDSTFEFEATSPGSRLFLRLGVAPQVAQ